MRSIAIRLLKLTRALHRRSSLTTWFLVCVTCAIVGGYPLGAGQARATTPLPAMTFTLTPIVEGSEFRAVDVILTFNGSASGKTRLRLPNEWGGERELYRAIHQLRADSGTLSDGETAAQRVLKHAPNAPITLRYRIIAEEASARKQMGNDYRPIITPQFFQLLGNNTVIQAEHIPSTAPARFILGTMPSGTRFASDLEHQSMGRRLIVADLIDSVMVGGDFRVLDAGGGARIAIRGQWERTDAQWQASLTKIGRTMRAYWGANDEPYLVTILANPPMAPGSVSVGGTGRDDAFAFFATTNAPPERLDRVMAHEMMHTWVPRRVGSLRLKNEQLGYWLSEGFTDWAAWRVMVRAGLWTPIDFAKEFNEAVSKYDASPVRTAPNQTVLEKFWSDPAVQTLPYQRGMLLATYWDAAVRKATDGKASFDQVLLEMQRLALAKRDSPPTDEGAVDHLRTAMQTIAKLDISEDLRRYVDSGEAAPLPEDAFAPCGTFGTFSRPRFHRGFDVEATQRNKNIIAGVIVGGPAYRAGLRDGMRLLGRRGGEIGNATVEITYDVEDTGTGEPVRRSFSYLPEGEGTESFRALRLHQGVSSGADAALSSACARRLGSAK